MTKFLYGSEINSCIEQIISGADTYLFLVSPYIKLHTRVKDGLKKQKANHKLEIVVMFGKNEDDPAKSLSSVDIELLKELPNIKICYSPNLHAKYYASDKCTLVTSMNMYQLSQNENVEVGVQMFHKSFASLIVGDIIASDADPAEAGLEYIEGEIDKSEVLFHKVPEYSSRFFTKEYTGSRIDVDETHKLFKKNSLRIESKPIKPLTQPRSASVVFSDQSRTGFCIRTRAVIPYDPGNPMSADALKSWKRFANPEYQEKYCHYSGELSNGNTTFSRPILSKYWNEAKRVV